MRFSDKPLRLQKWNYVWDAVYFITICTKNREHYFGNIVNGTMQFSNIGVLADTMWYEIKNHAKNIILGAFTVMPNHIHGIIILNGNQEYSEKIDKNPESKNHPTETEGSRHALIQQIPPSNNPTNKPIISQPDQPYNNKPTTNQTIGHRRFQNQGKNTISSIVGSYKSAVTKHAHRLGYEFEWQSRFYDHIIRDDKSFKRIENYIIQNPKKWEEDKFRED